MSDRDQFEYGEKRTFFGRFGFAIGIGVLAIVGIILVRKMFTGQSHSALPKPVEMVMIKATPPPTPPPPPPPPPENQPKEQMEEQSPVDAAEAKPVDDPSPSPAIGTNITGSGPADGFGLGHNTGGSLGGGGRNGNSGSRFGWYAARMSTSVQNALGQDPRTGFAGYDIKVRFWPDATGRVTRAKLAKTTGDAALDDAIIRKLIGLQVEAPPDGMKLPIVTHIVARRPN